MNRICLSTIICLILTVATHSESVANIDLSDWPLSVHDRHYLMGNRAPLFTIRIPPTWHDYGGQYVPESNPSDDPTFVEIFDRSESSVEELLTSPGSQFSFNRVQQTTAIVVDGFKSFHTVVTNGTCCWKLEFVVIPTQEFNYRIFSSSIGLAEFEGFWSSFRLVRKDDPFPDVFNDHIYASAIRLLKQRYVIQGTSGGRFEPQIPINRAEFTKIVVNAARHAQGVTDDALEGKNCFTDVADEWFAPFVCTAKESGLIGGYPDGTFRPAQNVNFVEAAKIVANAFDLETKAESSGEWYVSSAKRLGAENAIPASITSLDQEITRGEMAEMIYRLMEGITDQPAASADDLLS